MSSKVRVSACVLNQWAMDFEGNLRRIVKSIDDAKEAGSRLRLGSELEIPGYGCQDHFLESDTFTHSWEVLAELIRHSKDRWPGLLIATSLPVLHRCVGYNCVAFLLDGQLLLIRPKRRVCDDANYRETRWFVPWSRPKETHTLILPSVVTDVFGQKTVEIGDAVLEAEDTTIGCETCEELWTANSTHVSLAQDGVEIILNASGSHFELRKSAYQLNSLICASGEKIGGVYVFSNQRGCDGDRLYYDGSATVALNGVVRARAPQFGLSEVEVVTATIDLDEVRVFRNRIRSSSLTAAASTPYPRVRIEDWALGCPELAWAPVSPAAAATLRTAEEEIAMGPACWLWDYLRRSGQGGFFVPLSGGRDSAAVVTVVYSMATLLAQAAREGDEDVLAELNRVCGAEADFDQTDARAICGRLLRTAFLGTANSSAETRDRAARLADQIGAKHSSVKIDAVVTSVLAILEWATGKTPRFTTFGGESRENLALQNIQARVRMVVSYLFAQLSLWSEGRPGGLLVLATGNVDEGLRGYLTKYDCSSGDINPIGSISKMDLDAFLRYAKDKWGLDSLDGILDAPPTAELVPLVDGKITQTDEEEMGMTYKELSRFGQLRLPGGCGPFSMFSTLVHEWADRKTPTQVGAAVMHFFRCYAMNRHKATVSTPAVHAEPYSPDDHRHDHRPFLYNVAWPWQFKRIKEAADQLEKSSTWRASHVLKN